MDKEVESMEAFKTIIWDWNGTLLNDGDFSKGIINQMLESRGLKTLTIEEHRKHFDFPVELYYQRVGFDLETEPFETLSEQFVKSYVSGVKRCFLYNGVPELLKSIQESGRSQLILSASHQDYLDELITYYNLASYFNCLLGIDSIHAPGKSGRGIEWLSKSGINSEEILMIGDTFHDHEVAEAMGIECWLVADGHHGKDRLMESGRVVLNNLTQVTEKLLDH